jgi:hypothetical protein
LLVQFDDVRLVLKGLWLALLLLVVLASPAIAVDALGVGALAEGVGAACRGDTHR